MLVSFWLRKGRFQLIVGPAIQWIAKTILGRTAKSADGQKCTQLPSQANMRIVWGDIWFWKLFSRLPAYINYLGWLKFCRYAIKIQRSTECRWTRHRRDTISMFDFKKRREIHSTFCMATHQKLCNSANSSWANWSPVRLSRCRQRSGYSVSTLRAQVMKRRWWEYCVDWDCAVWANDSTHSLQQTINLDEQSIPTYFYNARIMEWLNPDKMSGKVSGFYYFVVLV